MYYIKIILLCNIIFSKVNKVKIRVKLVKQTIRYVDKTSKKMQNQNNFSRKKYI